MIMMTQLAHLQIPTHDQIEESVIESVIIL